MHPTQTSYITLEPPDVAFWHMIGRVEESDIVRIYEAQLEFAKDKPYILVLADVTRFESMTANARRAAATGPKGGSKVMSVRGSAIIGASFHVQVLGLLVAKAAKAFHQQNDNETSFFDTEAQARAWVEKRRRELGGVHRG